MPVAMPAQRIRVDRDGIIAVRATCKRDTTCVGAILVDSFHVSYGRADLSIPAHATRRVPVGVTGAGLRYLRRHGKDRGFATVPLTDQNAPLSSSKTLTILAPH
jgi:hypothetical protein